MSAFDVIALIAVLWFCLEGQVVNWLAGRKPIIRGSKA